MASLTSKMMYDSNRDTYYDGRMCQREYEEKIRYMALQQNSMCGSVGQIGSAQLQVHSEIVKPAQGRHQLPVTAGQAGQSRAA